MTHKNYNTRSKKNKGSQPASKKPKPTLSASAEDSLKRVKERTIQKVTSLVPKDLEIITEKETPENSAQQQQSDDMETDTPLEVSSTSPEDNTASTSSQTSQDPTAPQQDNNVTVTPQTDTNND